MPLISFRLSSPIIRVIKGISEECGVSISEVAETMIFYCMAHEKALKEIVDSMREAEEITEEEEAEEEGEEEEEEE